MLEAVRVCGLTKTCKVYQASTSELYGKVEEVPQKETTPFHPYSPYAVAKQYGFWMVKEYRDAYGMFAVNGILFNHESERRGENFVTRKITLAAGRIAEGLQDHLELGNMDSLRDWGYVMHVAPSESVVVCPVDPYVEDGYFEALKELSEQADKCEANLVLMGIEPTYPSEKYGYIIPESTDHVAEVRTFREKPTADVAEQYIAQGALWNGGVFAYKLGYVIWLLPEHPAQL